MATRSTKNSAPHQTRTRSGKGTDTASNGPAATVTDDFPGTEAPSRTMPEQASSSTVETPMSPTTPMLLPPELRDADSVSEAAVESVTGTVRSNQYIDALWSIDQVRNAYALVRGLGWRKLYNGRDGAFLALTLLASQARQTGSSVTFREEPDGMIYELYLW